MTDLIPFDYSGRQVRVLTIDNEPWFVGRDATTILGYRTTNDGTRWLDEDERDTHWVRTPGGDQEMVIVSEPGLYSLILRSKRPEAKAFKRWVTHEVLPTIRKTGSYGVARFDPRNLDHVAQLAQVAAAQAREIEAAKPKLEAFDAYMEADNALSMGAVANQLGIGRNTMMRKLREAGVLQKNNRPYQQHAHHFKVVAQTYEAQNETRATHTTYVKPTGVELIRRVLSGGKGLLAITGGVA